MGQSLGLLIERCRNVFDEAPGQASPPGFLLESHPNPQSWTDRLVEHSEIQLRHRASPQADLEAAYLLISRPRDTPRRRMWTR